MISKLNLDPSRKQLKAFGITLSLVLSVIGLMFYLHDSIPLLGLTIAISLGVIILLLSMVCEKVIKPLYKALLIMTYPISWLISHFVIVLIYYLVITPIALFFRLTGRDILFKKYDANVHTYWIKYHNRRAIDEYFRQS